MNPRKNIRVGWPFRIILPVLLTLFLYMWILFGMALPMLENNVLLEKKEGTRLLTDAAWSVVQEYYGREQSGELSRAEAQGRAADRVRAMRYGLDEENYFWITDLTPSLVAHPYRRDLEGSDLSDYEDPNGVQIFQEFIRAAEKGEGGYVDYLWQDQGDTTRILPKQAYVRKFAPWGWIVGTGLNMEDIQADVTHVRQEVGAISALGLAAVLLLSATVVFRTVLMEDRRRAAEEEVERQRDFLENVIQSLAHPFTVIDAADGKIALSNETARNGPPPTRPCFCITHDRDIAANEAAHRCPLDVVIESRQPATVEQIYVDDSGSPHYVEIHGYPILDADGALTQIIMYSLDITARKQVELQLREKEEQFRLLYERAPISYQSLDEEARFLTVNEAWLEELGYTRKEVLGRWFGDFLPPEDRELFQKRFALFQAAGEVQGVEFWMCRKNGERILMAFDGKIGHDENNHFQQTHCVLRNITAQRAAEKALQESERRYREISEIISDFAYSVRVLPDGRFQKEWATGSAMQLLGVDMENFFSGGSLISQGLIHPDDRERYLQRMEAFQRKETVVTEYRLLPQDGEPVWVRHYGKPVWDEDENRLVRILGAVQDISEQKRMEQALHESEDRYRVIFEGSYSPMLLLDAKSGQIIEANRAAAAFYGYREDTLRGMNISAINTLDEEELITERAHAVREERNHFLFPHRLASGEIRHVEVYSGPISLEGRKLLYSIVHDVTERVRSQMENLRLVAAVEQAKELIVITDLEGKIIYVNPFFCEVTGYSREEALGSTPRMVKSGLQTDSYYQQLWETIAAGKTWTGQFINRRKDGSLYHEEAIIFPVKDDRGRTINYASVKRDISDQIRAEQNIQRQVQRLSALRNIDTAISASMDLKLVLDILLEQTRRELGMDAADILLYNATFQKLDLIAWQGFKSTLTPSLSLRLGRSLPGRVAMSREPVFLPDLSQQPPVEVFTAEVREAEGFMAYGCVPLVAKGELKGVLEVHHRTPTVLGDEWVEFMETLGGQAAIAIENAGLFERLQRANTELVLAYDTTLKGWAKALELRDQETKGHSDHVTEITLLMAQAYGIPSAEMIHIRRGALLHDIGKMGIPDSILLKPAALTPQEWEVMRKHPVYAYELLSPISFLRPALDIPYSHHERWNGTGYPRGLRGEEIPLAARIFAVVDVWQALSSDRPYRDAWPQDKVKAYLRDQSGIHFDPHVVSLFLEKLEAGQFHRGGGEAEQPPL